MWGIFMPYKWGANIKTTESLILSNALSVILRILGFQTAPHLGSENTSSLATMITPPISQSKSPACFFPNSNSSYIWNQFFVRWIGKKNTEVQEKAEELHPFSPPDRCFQDLHFLGRPTWDSPNVSEKTCWSKPGVSFMDVSKNRGTPKWMVYNGKPY